MAALKVTVFLFFILFHILKGNVINKTRISVATTEANPTILTGTTNKGETTAVETDHPNSSMTSGETTTQGAGSLESTGTAISSSTSGTNASTIVPSTGTENSTAETTTPKKNETIVDNSTAAQPTFISMASTLQSTYSITPTSKAEVTDPAFGSEPSTAPTTSGSSSLSVLAFAVIILILILVIIMVILVGVISMRLKCCDFEDVSQDTRKVRSAAPSESSQVNGEKEGIALVSMRTLTEAGAQESTVQGSLQNDSTEAAGIKK
ncbi:endothelial cell-specific chemotaxis regulator isoform X1 [Carcharodon carcharias]|uniref:endothelial cell-specific chemotaxis regulator isoform X1 n=1 Tax=Carcharodon carcharias TaxID=13397 RepID=UPI001B7E3C09|nr:endothelial cell-specific chemotaxis regulator isoform X1 [Carcharodon carcharias]